MPTSNKAVDPINEQIGNEFGASMRPTTRGSFVDGHTAEDRSAGRENLLSVQEYLASVGVSGARPS